jgi:drug/metabolite transporter (DMT)-like permease
MTALKRMVTMFEALPGSSRGIFWMIFATVFYASTYASVRFLSTDFDTFQIVFFRSTLGVILMLPWLMRSGIGVLRTNRFGMYAMRTGLNYVGMVLLMYALASLPLQNITGLMFTSPLFTVMFVAAILGERVGIRRWTALVIGFLGAMIIIRPGLIEVSWTAIGVLVTSALYALVNTTTKSLATTEPSNKIVFFVFFLMMLIGMGPAIATWKPIALEHIPWIIALGIFSSLATQGVTRALSVADASVVMPFNFLKLPFATVLGFIFFAEQPDFWTGIGAAVIFAGTYYIARREATLRARAKADQKG